VQCAVQQAGAAALRQVCTGRGGTGEAQHTAPPYLLVLRAQCSRRHSYRQVCTWELAAQVRWTCESRCIVCRLLSAPTQQAHVYAASWGCGPSTGVHQTWQRR
jgi:hypothetical protein